MNNMNCKDEYEQFIIHQEFKSNKAINIPEEYTLNSEIICDVGEVAKVYNDIWTEVKIK